MFNDELPVENVGDGDGTFVAGQPNKYLGLKHGVSCPVALVYLIREFSNLAGRDQFAWMSDQDIGYLALSAILAEKIPSSLSGILAAVEADVTPEQVDDYATQVNDFLEASVDLDEFTMEQLVAKTTEALEEMVANQDKA